MTKAVAGSNAVAMAPDGPRAAADGAAATTARAGGPAEGSVVRSGGRIRTVGADPPLSPPPRLNGADATSANAGVEAERGVSGARVEAAAR